jgi:hypothetical protein
MAQAVMADGADQQATEADASTGPASPLRNSTDQSGCGPIWVEHVGDVGLIGGLDLVETLRRDIRARSRRSRAVRLVADVDGTKCHTSQHGVLGSPSQCGLSGW